MANRLVREFGTLDGLLEAEPLAVSRVGGERAAQLIDAIRTFIVLARREQAFAGCTITSLEALTRYLVADLGHKPVEHFKVLYLNSANHLLHEGFASVGSVSSAPVNTREVMRRALAIGATAIILVHNHPSGDPEPSEADLLATRRLAEVGRELDIVVHDHVIVARSGWVSLRARGYM